MLERGGQSFWTQTFKVKDMLEKMALTHCLTLLSVGAACS